MISKRDIKKMVKNVTKRDRGIPDKRLLHPAREWVIALVLSVVMLSLGSLWTYAGFSEYADISLESQILESSEINYDRIDINDAIELYDVHLLEYKSLTGEVPKVIVEETEPAETEVEVEGSEPETENELEVESEPGEDVGMDETETEVVPDGGPVLE